MGFVTLCVSVCTCAFLLSLISQPIVWSFKAKFANSIIMLEITKEGANGCSCYCKPDFHRLSRAWHMRGKFGKRGPAAVALSEQLDFCCQPQIEAGPWNLLATSCNALRGLSPSRSLTCYSFLELKGECCYTGQYKLRLRVSTEAASGRRCSVVCPLRKDNTAPKKVEENGGIHLIPSSVLL